MKTFPLTDENGSQFGFSIESVYIGIRTISKLLSMRKNISIIKSRKLFDVNNEIHIEFDYEGERFIVWEPFSDNSQYLIMPKDKINRNTDISELEGIFLNYKPPVILKVFGDILSMKCIKFQNKNK